MLMVIINLQVGNFIAGAEMQGEVAAGRSVVLDRYYASTTAYILGKKVDIPIPAVGEAPAAGDDTFTWPAELYKPTHMFVLVLPEADREQRRLGRTSVAETPEEKLLSQNPHIAERINRVYELLGCTRIDLVASDGIEAVLDKIIAAIRAATP